MYRPRDRTVEVRFVRGVGGDDLQLRWMLALLGTLLLGLVVVFVVVVSRGHAVDVRPGTAKDEDSIPASAASHAVEASPNESKFEKELALAVRERDDATAESSVDPEEVERLRARVKELEAEVERLGTLVREGDHRRRRLKAVLESSSLEHEALWLDAFELFLDAEEITDDPSRAFPLIRRLVEETGLASAPLEDDLREVHPEPKAPETELGLGLRRDDTSRAPKGSAPILVEYVSLGLSLELPQNPEIWVGDDTMLSLGLEIERSAEPVLEFYLEVNGPRSYFGNDFEIKFEWSPSEASISRSPWRGGTEHRDLEPGEFTELRAAIEELFQWLKARAR